MTFVIRTGCFGAIEVIHAVKYIFFELTYLFRFTNLCFLECCTGRVFMPNAIFLEYPILDYIVIVVAVILLVEIPCLTSVSQH